MTYFLGLIGILQMMLLPGLILYRIFNPVKQKNFWLNLPLIFALSLVFNYFLVFILTGLHWYEPHLLRSIAAIEILLLLYAYPRFWSLPIATKMLDLNLFARGKSMPEKYTHFYLWAFIVILIAFFVTWINDWGIVFGVRDPAVSYNAWAISWANNQFPLLTWHYPQLLPANWSIPYVMMGTLPNHIVIEMFSAGLNEIFPILFMLIFFDLFRREHNRAYLIAAVIIALFMCAFWVYVHNGYADWVCAFFNLLALKLLYDLSLQQHTHFPWRSYWQILLVIAAAALTKPAGISTAVLVPLLMAALIRFPKLRPEWLLVRSYLILMILILPWYIYAEHHEVLQSHGSDLLFLVWQIFRLNSWPFFVQQALQLGWIAMFLMLTCFFFSKSLPKFWRFVFYFYSPYFFLWLFFYSYDNRNLDFLLPVLAIGTGLIISHHQIDISVISYLKKISSKFNKLWVLLLILVFIAVAEYNVNTWHRGHLIQHQINAKDQINNGRAGFIAVKNYVNCPGLKGDVLSPMLIYNTIPMLTPYMITVPPEDYGANMLPQVFNDPVLLKKTLMAHPNIRYFLIDMRFKLLVTSEATRTLIQNWLDTGKIKIVLDNDKMRLYEIMVPLDQLNFTVPAASKK